MDTLGRARHTRGRARLAGALRRTLNPEMDSDECCVRALRGFPRCQTTRESESLSALRAVTPGCPRARRRRIMCPVQGAMNALRMIEARALGRNLAAAELSGRMLPELRSPLVFDRLQGRIYNARFVGEHGCFVASAQNTCVRVYDAGNPVKPSLTHEVSCDGAVWTVTDVDVLLDGPVPRYLAYSTLSSTVEVIDLGDQQSRCPLDLSAPNAMVKAVFSIAFSGDGNSLVAGTGLNVGHTAWHEGPGGVALHDMAAGVVKGCVRAHDRDTNSVGYLSVKTDPNLVISGGDDGLAKLWDMRQIGPCETHQPNEPAATFVGHTKGLSHVHSRGDGRFFLSTSKDQSIKLWDVRKPSCSNPANWRIHRDLAYDYRSPFLPSPTPTPDDATDSSVVTYRGGHKVLRTLIRSAFSPASTTGQQYVYVGSSDGTCAIYETTTGNLLSKLSHHMDMVREASWHPQLPVLTTSSFDQTIRVWSPTTNCHCPNARAAANGISREYSEVAGGSEGDAYIP